MRDHWVSMMGVGDSRRRGTRKVESVRTVPAEREERRRAVDWRVRTVQAEGFDILRDGGYGCVRGWVVWVLVVAISSDGDECGLVDR